MMGISTVWIILIHAINLFIMIKDVTKACNEELQLPILVKKLKDDNLEFAFALFQNYAVSRNDNVLISNIGVTSVMGMTILSTKGKSGNQLKEIFKTLKVDGEFAINQAISDVLNSLCVSNGSSSAETTGTATTANSLSASGSTSASPSSSSPETNSTIYSVTGIFIDIGTPNTIRSSFLTTLANLYNTTVSKIDLFQSSNDLINEFLTNSTSHEISKISIPNLPKFQLIFVNAVYLKIKWEEGFEKRFTRKWQFHVSPTRKVMVEMMGKQGEVAYTNRLDMRFRVVKLNCAGKRMSAYIILPYDMSDFHRVERALTPINFRSVVASLRPTNLVLRLPKFIVQAQTNLSRIFKKMGYDEMFDKQSADLRGMFLRGNGIAVSEIFHLAKIEVDDDGEKPRSTSRNFTSHSVEFTVDHPCIFIIEDQISGLIIFLGRLTNP